MEAFEQFVFYPVLVLLGIFLVILSFKLLFRLLLLCVVIFLLWYLLSYLGFVDAPKEYILNQMQQLKHHEVVLVF